MKRSFAMKRFTKKSSAVLIAVSILLIAVAITVFAAGIIDTITPDEAGVQAVMRSITGEVELSESARLMADFNNDSSIDVLDVIALKKFTIEARSFDDGWTVGVY